MRAGQLRHRVTLQQKVAASPDRKPSGAPDTSWQDVATVYAAIEPLRGREFMESMQVQAEVTTRIRIRYRSDVDNRMRATRGSTVYSIVAVLNLETRDRELHLMCTEGVNNG